MTRIVSKSAVKIRRVMELSESKKVVGKSKAERVVEPELNWIHFLGK